MTLQQGETAASRVLRVLKSFLEAKDKGDWIATKIENRRRQYAWRKFERRLKQEHLINEAFDRRHGTDTAEEVALTDAGVPAGESVRGNVVYRSVWESEFHSSLASLGIAFDGFAFVDIGSGKGKLLLLASDYPFARIIGVEYAPGLHAIAQANVSRYRSSKQRCRVLEPMFGDALQYRLPEGPIVCYIFNALDPATMKTLMQRVDDDLGSRVAPAFVIYSNLRHISEIADGFAPVKKLHLLKRMHKLLVYGNAAAKQLFRPGTAR